MSFVPGELPPPDVPLGRTGRAGADGRETYFLLTLLYFRFFGFAADVYRRLEVFPRFTFKI